MLGYKPAASEKQRKQPVDLSHCLRKTTCPPLSENKAPPTDVPLFLLPVPLFLWSPDFPLKLYGYFQ